jgi:multicomponent Na+:H+ antiporter subunit D
MLFFDSGIRAAGYAALLLVGLASIFTLIYTIRAFQCIWWRSPAQGITTKAGGDRLLAPAILVALTLILGIWAQPLVNIAQRASAWLGDPALYIQAVLGG